MRAYTASSEEALRARALLKDWAGEGFLTESQYRRMEQETIFELRCTNIFLRLVLFLFTLILVWAAAALFFVVSDFHVDAQATVPFLLIFAAISYACAEVAVSRARLYRYGIEEALAICSVVFLCAGLQVALFGGRSYSPKLDKTECVIPAVGAAASLWLWHRFGFAYAFLAAMTFILWLPHYWTSSHSAQHLIVAAFYTAGLLIVVAMRPRHRFTYLNDAYSFVEAVLWLGIYLAINLHVSSLELLRQWWASPRPTTEFSTLFYWATWVLTWCVPPIVLARGLLQKDRFVVAVGTIIAFLTLVTNKSYLGWQRHTWDPILLGALLICVALLLRRWLAAAPGAIRYGFTAKRLSAKDRHWMNAGSVALGLTSASSITLGTQPGSHEVPFEGGDFGGGGGSSKF